MSRLLALPLLRRALALSRELAAVAESGDVARAVSLDAERLELLRSACAMVGPPGAEERTLLREIAALNDLAIGSLEHRRRGKARELDMAQVGRRALLAYSATR